MLAFFIAHGFPYVYISSFFRKTFKIKVDNQLIESLFHFIILQLQGTLTFQNSKNTFFVISSSFENYHLQGLRMNHC